jgi:hypothetical protein
MPSSTRARREFFPHLVRLFTASVLSVTFGFADAAAQGIGYEASPVFRWVQWDADLGISDGDLERVVELSEQRGRLGVAVRRAVERDARHPPDRLVGDLVVVRHLVLPAFRGRCDRRPEDVRMAKGGAGVPRRRQVSLVGG